MNPQGAAPATLSPASWQFRGRIVNEIIEAQRGYRIRMTAAVEGTGVRRKGGTMVRDKFVPKSLVPGWVAADWPFS